MLAPITESLYGVGQMDINIHAQAMGRLGKGRQKTISPAAIRQRKQASKAAAKARSRAAKERRKSQ
jgi:hypothetical protein